MDLPDFIRARPSARLPFPEDAVTTHVLPSRQGLLVIFDIREGIELPPHRHGAQWGTVLSGWLDLTIAGETRRYAPGMCYSIPAGVEHAARLPAGAMVLDLFEEPDRYDLRDAADVTEPEVAEWLAAYGRAWEAGDAEGVLSLFASDAAYFETPFDPPMVGHAAIRHYWQEGAREGQRGVRFAHALWAVRGTEAVAHWSASFTRAATGAPVRLDGAFRLVFARGADGRPLCTELREWWHAG
jgi:uncharacterized protein (TIGR02246 family)